MLESLVISVSDIISEVNNLDRFFSNTCKEYIYISN